MTDSTTFDERCMDAALAAARAADFRTSPNPMVGAALVRDGVVLGVGAHMKAGAAHAEAVALEAVGARASGACLLVTLEPCNHAGRRPPCTDAIIAAGVRRVVVATRDPNRGVAGGGIEALRAAGIDVELGVRRREAELLNEFYLHHAAEGRPFVTAKFAASLDGRIATKTGDSQWITGRDARARGHRLRHEHDAVLVGAGTVERDDPRLTARIDGEEPRQPLRVVVDSRLRRSVTHAIHAKGVGSSLVATTTEAPRERRTCFESAGIELLVLPAGPSGRVDLEALLDALGSRGLLSILVEGGPTLLGGFSDHRLIDKVVGMVAPRLIGGPAPGAVGGAGVEVLQQAPALRDVVVERAGIDVVVTGYCKT